MPHRHYPPAYLRYLKARLWNLGRPGFWGTAIFLSVVGLATWEYWSNPGIFVYKQKKPVVLQKSADSSLSEENKAIAADIDNLPVLFNDFEQATLSLNANAPEEKTDAKKSKGLLDDVINKQKSANNTKLNPGLGVNGDTSPAAKNPFVQQTDNLLRTGTVDSSNPFLGLKTLNTASEPTGADQTSSSLGVGFTNQTNKNQNSLSINPLQAALNQSTNQKLSSFSGTTATQTNALGQVSAPGTTLMPPINSLTSQNSLPNTGVTPGTDNTSTGTNFPQNPYTYLNNGQVVPNNGLTTGTNLPQNPYTYLNNGQVVPNVAPSNIVPYSSQSPSQSVVTPTNPVGYGNYGLQQPTQPPQSTYGNYGLQQPMQPPQTNYGNNVLQQPTQLPQSNYGNYGLQQPTQLPRTNYGNNVLQQPTQSNSVYLRQLRDRYRNPGQN
ncbi:hypothetical protein CDG76_24055 [Nostoc sp. 'Peltigera membranacea cyanobiont' 210A]|uniref:hypothetical protein n=1 Tax=Nostoc sp. 'Peltigera membranacea cyanobiont' 210A TaxID=2014529 RepID=UPI000B95682A|nr:hypothetical protein [Nostoc sp. 'Peltigera membranacea cyanobiont' 210A]OYD92592.1 hypothetical protein CDG76_24055 [Nostoc sp. 'Peltigera membranacea cyanobiont' 210A]